MKHVGDRYRIRVAVADGVCECRQLRAQHIEFGKFQNLIGWSSDQSSRSCGRGRRETEMGKIGARDFREALGAVTRKRKIRRRRTEQNIRPVTPVANRSMIVVVSSDGPG